MYRWIMFRYIQLTSLVEWSPSSAQPSLPWGTYFPLTLSKERKILIVIKDRWINSLLLTVHNCSCQYLMGIRIYNIKTILRFHYIRTYTRRVYIYGITFCGFFGLFRCSVCQSRIFSTIIHPPTWSKDWC